MISLIQPIRQLGAGIILFLGATLQIAQASPVLLSDLELDRISGGYVDLEVSAKATAIGPKSVARFSADVQQTYADSKNGKYIYTTTTGYADAFAKGRKVSTEVGYIFGTDEKILSFSVEHYKHTSKKSGRKNKDKKASKKKRPSDSGKKKQSSKPKKNKNSKPQKNKKPKHSAGSKKSANKTGKNSAKKNSKKGKSYPNSKRNKVVREHQKLKVTIVTRRRAT